MRSPGCRRWRLGYFEVPLSGASEAQEMIINIRGTNGSGKSTIAKKFIQQYSHVEIFGVSGPRRPEAYKVRLPGRWLYVVGSYQSATGGIDALPLGAIELVALLEKYRKLGHVLFEGVVVSTYFGAVGAWLQAHKDEAVVGFLDTSLDVCLASIEARTGEASRTKNVESKVKAIENVRLRMNDLGIRTEILKRGNAFETIKSWLK